MTNQEKSDFDLFWENYPIRKGDRAKAPAQVLFDRAVKSGVNPEDIIQAAKMYANSEKENVGTPYIMQAQRWLRNKRWMDYTFNSPMPKATCVGSQFFVKEDSPQWLAWQEHLKKTTGRGSPCRNFGWWFPSEWPPGITHQQPRQRQDPTILGGG